MNIQGHSMLSRGSGLHNSSGPGQAWPFQAQQEGHWSYSTENKVDGGRKGGRDTGLSQGHLGFIGSGEGCVFYPEIHWRVLRWGMTWCFSKLSQAAVRRKDQRRDERGAEWNHWEFTVIGWDEVMAIYTVGSGVGWKVVRFTHPG